jgi:trehalose 6-phosphate synthase/phosphatase
MDSVLQQRGGVWIGWPGTQEQPPAEALALLEEKHSCVAVDLPPPLAKAFYEGYANRALWPLLHSFPSRMQFEPAEWQAYVEGNRAFCAAVVARHRPGDRIWVHDYHLLLLPAMLREQLPDASIGFFLHVPFPASDIFAALPRGDEVLAGLLGADLAGFHTHIYLQHFRRSLRRLLGMESAIDRVALPARDLRLHALPIGIAPEELSDILERAETQERLRTLGAQFAGRKLIVSVDRLDYTKGLPERLRAFRRLLRSEPELHGKVVLLQVAAPSRENIGSYQALRREVHELISQINGEFGAPDWAPVVYIHRGVGKAELAAFYRLADVAWVSPLRDGMNLVAKEYAACKPDGNGVLVLSAFAGAAAEMGEALLINPYDEEGAAAAVKRALTMADDEKRGRMRPLYQRVLQENVFVWGKRFLSLLDDSVRARGEREREAPPPVPGDEIARAYCAAAKRALLLDYDGTLAPFTALPQDAAPDRELLEILTRLAADPANTTIVVSGRRTADLERWLGHIPRLGLAAEHGARLRMTDGWDGRPAPAEWKPAVREILEHFAARIPGSSVEEKEFALVWHYRMAEAEFGDWLGTELVAMLDGMLAETELRAYQGNKIVEVKPSWANKGGLVERLAPLLQEAGFRLAIGDDRTDEDLFAAMPQDSWTIHVGRGSSRAKYRLRDVTAARRLLRRLISLPARGAPVL